MTLSIDEIAIYVKQEIGRDLFENVDKKHCVIDIWISQKKIDKQIARVSQYFLNERKSQLKKIYIENKNTKLFYRKQEYEKILNLYINEKYYGIKQEDNCYVKNKGIEYQEGRLNQNLLNRIVKMEWLKIVRPHYILYKSIGESKDEYEIFKYIEKIHNKNKNDDLKLKYRNQYILCDVRYIKKAIKAIETTNPKRDRDISVSIIHTRAYDRENKKKLCAKDLNKKYHLGEEKIYVLMDEFEKKCIYNKKGKCMNGACIPGEKKKCIYYEHFQDIVEVEVHKKEIKDIAKRVHKREKEIKNIQPIVKQDTLKKKQCRLINIKDFVVRTTVFKCMHKHHTIENIDAVVDIHEDDGKKHSVKITAGYCAQCNIYFIMDSVYQNLKRQGIILCRITDEKTYLKGGFMNGAKLAQESILMQYGYNVSQMEGLSATRRQKILAVIIDNKVLSKNEIISYLDFFIRQHGRRSNMELAVAKWEDDRDFVEHYRIGEYTQYGVNAIHRR